jgi:hypothetical protein
LVRSFLPLIAAALGCGQTGAAQDAAPAQGGAGVRTVDCSALGTGGEACSYTFAFDPTTCANRGCKRLVIYFSGGQESCPDPGRGNSYLAYYRERGYVAVCAMAFQTSTGSGQFPRHKEAARFDALVRGIAADPAIQGAWSGEHLLLSGVSHGGSGPVVAMATTAFDDQPSWRGSKYTGACFYDGTYDVPGLLQFHASNQCRTIGSVVPYERTYSRYCAWPARAGGNLPATWPAPATCANADTMADTVASASVDAFAIHDWKLVECGSALDPCLQDVLPAPAIAALCARIAATPGYSCAPESFPNIGHIACGIEASSIGSCHAWFDQQLVKRGF